MGMFDSSRWQRGAITNRKAVAKAKRVKAKAAKREQSKVDLNNPPAYKVGMPAALFYLTREWRKVRWKVLQASDGRCCMCGNTAQTSGRPMHVDHAIPRSTAPSRELDQSNLQVLCEQCNLGKGATSWSKPADTRKENK